MKRLILSALLLGAVTVQSAQAAVRTFDFSGSITGFLAPTPGGAIPGPTGDPVAVGDTVKGQFTFDDMGLDWTAPQAVTGLPVQNFYVTYGSSDEADKSTFLEWYLEPHPTGQGYRFGITPYNPLGRPVNLGVSFQVGTNVPFWDVNSGATGSLFARWFADSSIQLLFADITNVTEVSPVPEPSAYAMLLLGLAGVGAASLRRGQGRYAPR